MKYALVFVFFALLGAGLAFEEQEISEDFQDEVEMKVRNRRWLFQDNCRAHSDCGNNKCCYDSWFGDYCVSKRKLFQSCSTSQRCNCFCSCVEGLECRPFGNLPAAFGRYCLKPRPTKPPTAAPTEEPGSGAFELE